MADSVSHPLIKAGSMEKRDYQEKVVAEAAAANVMCVLPTGLGKTPIAVMVAALRLSRFPDSRVLVMAPTRPLVSQHMKSFAGFFNMPDEKLGSVDGTVHPEERKEIYRDKVVIFATPQTVANDLHRNRVSLKNFSLLVLDEVHHAVGKYSYLYVTKRYQKEADNPRLLGLTASPGWRRDKVDEVFRNAGMENVCIMSEDDEEVRPWVRKKHMEWVEVSLPGSFMKIKLILDEAFRKRAEKLAAFGLKKPPKYVNRRDLLDLQTQFHQAIRRGNRMAFSGASLVAQLIKLEHARDLLGTQGISQLEAYWSKLRDEDSRAAARLLNDRDVSGAAFLTRKLFEAGSRHPKISELCRIVHTQFAEKPDSRIIVFANYRNSVREIVKVLSGVAGARPAEFVGQKEGMSQKEQAETLDDFRKGKYNVLIGTSVAEEGLDIPAMDVAVFYEAVPSEIRAIQRRGRVGRQAAGRIIILITKGTRDEAYHWTSRNKESRMHSTLSDMRRGIGQDAPAVNEDGI
jgi:Fanconi anemia group M protein